MDTLKARQAPRLALCGTLAPAMGNDRKGANWVVPGAGVERRVSYSKSGRSRRWGLLRQTLRLVDRSIGRSAGFAPAKSCRPNRRRAAKVDEGHRADEDREFLFFVADVPDADYFTRCVLYWVITRLVQLAEDVDLAVESLTFVDIHYRFSLRVQDGPKRPALYAARHIGGYADIIITRLYEKRSRAAGLSLDPVDNREVVVHLG